MKSAEKYVGIEVHAFGHGMYTLFQGVAEVFSSLGIKTPEMVEEQNARWSPGKKEGGHIDDAASTETTGTDITDAADSPDLSADVENDVEEDESLVADENNDTKAATKLKKKKTRTEATSLSQDDITKIIVQKIKQDRGNSARIEQLLKAHGAARVSELEPVTYEAFITDLVAL